MKRAALPAAVSTHLAVVGGSGLMLASGVLTGVISARWLGPEARGEYTAAATWAAFLAVVASAGVPQALVVDSGPLRRLVRPLTIHIVAAFTVALLAGTALALTYQPWLTPGGVIGVGLTAAGGVVSGIAAGLAQRLGRMRFYFQVARVAPPSAAVVTMVLLVATASRSPNVWLLVTGAALFAVGSAILVAGLPRRDASGPWVYDAEFRLATIGAFAVAVVTQAVYRLDSLVMGLVGVPHDVAFYAVGAAALAASSALTQTSGLIAFSRLRGRSDRVTWNAVRRSCLQALVPAVVISAALVALMPWLIRALYGNDFMPALNLARVLVLATVPMAVDFVLSQVLLLQGHAGDIAKVRGAQLVIAVPAAWIIAGRADLPLLAALMGAAFVGSALVFGWMMHRALARAGGTTSRP